MRKDAPNNREIVAAERALDKKANEQAEALCGLRPGYKEDEAWRKKHPSPRHQYEVKLEKERQRLRAKAEELLLMGRMGQISSEEFYARVLKF